jgi:hypothetical protein
MLCPTCEIPAKGGSACPRCGGPIPELESFEGQGGHYLRVLLFISVMLFVGAITIASIRSHRPMSWDMFSGSRWFWLYAIVFALPAVIGIHFWYILRGEQVNVTDEYIERSSRWGDERVYWADVVDHRRQMLPLRQTRLGRVARLSNWLTGRRLIRRLPAYAYDLIAVRDDGETQLFRLEPGTTSDMDWLLKLISALAGEPVSD